MDNEYFLRRANEEMAAAERATTEEAKLIHGQLAKRYIEMIEDSPAKPARPERRTGT